MVSVFKEGNQRDNESTADQVLMRLSASEIY